MKRSSSTEYRPDIDGLRAIAVLSVVGYHCGIPWLRGGFIGVDVFFVISGYLICTIIYKDLRAGTFSIARFYERRFKRILPALCAVLLFCLAMAVLLMSPVEAKALGNSAVATCLSASNLLFMRQTGYFDGGSELKPLLMTWSLAVEEQFYFAFPLIMLLLRNRTKRSLIANLTVFCILSLIASILAEFFFPTLNFYLPLTRAWELGSGILLALWEVGRPKAASLASWRTEVGSAAGILLIVISVFCYSPKTRLPGYEAIVPVLGSVLILGSAGGRANRLLTIRPLIGVGLISYSLYLWHWPLLSFARIVSAGDLQPRTTIILMVMAFSAAIGSYYFVEKPFRAKTSVRTSSVLLAYGVLLLLLIGVCSILSFTHGLPGRVPELADIEFQAKIDRDHPCLVNRRSQLGLFCIPPPGGTRPSIALLGDSHAESISNALRDEVSKQGWQLLTLTHAKCPPTKGVTRWISAKDEESCRKFNETALNLVLSRADIRVVALLAGWGGRIYITDNYQGNPEGQSDELNGANLRDGVQSEIKAFESAGKQVILIDDFPELAVDPIEIVRYQKMPIRRALNRFLLSDEPAGWQSGSQDEQFELSPAKQFASEEFRKMLTGDSKLTFVDPKTVLCHSGKCSFGSPSQLYYRDGDHLSDIGAEQLMPLLPKLHTLNRGAWQREAKMASHVSP